MNRIVLFVFFLIFVVGLYAALNFYFIRKCSHVITGGSLSYYISRWVLAFLILSPILSLLLSWKGPPFPANLLSFIGYTWLTFLFLFLVGQGMMDLILILIKLRVGLSPLIPKLGFISISGLCVVILIFSYVSAQNIRSAPLTIRSKKLPPNSSVIKIALISDVHFSALVGIPTAKRIKEVIQDFQPDILLSAGDMVDRGVSKQTELTSILRQIEAPKGKFAVMGNHEFYFGIKKSSEFIQQAGFTLLRNNTVRVGDLLDIAGVDDPANHGFQNTNGDVESDTLSQVTPGQFTILLKHQPRIDPASINRFDLQLSGHTHAGQIFPFSLIVKIAYPYSKGEYRISDDSTLYVSRGTGTWGPPFRFLAPPEVTLISLVAE